MENNMILASDVMSDASSCAVALHPALGIQSTTAPVYAAPVDGTSVPAADRKADDAARTVTTAVSALPVFQGSPPRGAPV